jgi:large subunit ribosomal protein L2
MKIFYFTNFIKKRLIKGIKSKAGHNFMGRVCIVGCGGGNKKVYRYIDFYRRLNHYANIINIIYDPNRTAKIALVLYKNGLSSFILIQKNIKIKNQIYSGTKYDNNIIIKNGFSLPLKNMPLFSILSNIELRPFKGSSLCRAAGVSCILISKNLINAVLKLNSG